MKSSSPPFLITWHMRSHRQLVTAPMAEVITYTYVTMFWYVIFFTSLRIKK